MDGLKARLSFDAVAYDYDDEYLTIDTDTHTININNVSRLFGVQYDGNSKLIKFRVRNKLSDIQKMQDSIVYINWIDSRGVKGQSIAINKTINNDTCEFAWKVPFDALKNSGVLHFAMSAVVTKNSSSVIDQRWSTQIASVITPDGIYIKSYTPSSEEEDRIAQIYTELSNMINKQNDIVNSLKEDLAKLDNKLTPVALKKYIDLSGNTANIDSLKDSTLFDCYVEKCYPGEFFTLYVYNSGVKAAMYGFIDTDGNILSRAKKGFGESGDKRTFIVQAPNKASHVIFNIKGEAYRGFDGIKQYSSLNTGFSLGIPQSSDDFPNSLTMLSSSVSWHSRPIFVGKGNYLKIEKNNNAYEFYYTLFDTLEKVRNSPQYGTSSFSKKLTSIYCDYDFIVLTVKKASETESSEVISGDDIVRDVRLTVKAPLSVMDEVFGDIYSLEKSVDRYAQSGKDNRAHLSTIDFSRYMHHLVFIEMKEGMQYSNLKPDFNNTWKKQKWIYVTEPYMRLNLRKNDDSVLTTDDLKISFKGEKITPFNHGNCISGEFFENAKISTDGSIEYSEDSVVTNLISMPTHNPYNNYIYDPFKYMVCASLLNKLYEYNAKSVVFYDKNLNVLSVKENISDKLLTPKDAKFCRICYLSNSDKRYLCFNNDGRLDTYTEYSLEIVNKSFELRNEFYNSDGALTNLFRVCLEYAYNPEFGYGNHYTAFHPECKKVLSDGMEGGTTGSLYDGEKYQLDCSSFVKLALEGIAPKNSRYYRDKNYKSQIGYKFNQLAEYDTEYYRMVASKIAKYAYDNGYLYTIKNDLSNVQPGDLIFYTSAEKKFNFFKNIGHIGIAFYRWEVNDGIYKMKTIEVTTQKDVVQQVFLVKQKNDSIMYGARFPLPFVSLDSQNIVSNIENLNGSFNGENNGTVNIAKVTLDIPLKTKELYTVVLNTDIKNNAYIQIAINNGDTILGTYGKQLVRDEYGEYRTVIPLYQNITINNETANEIIVQAVSFEKGESYTPKLNKIKVVRGFYTAPFND